MEAASGLRLALAFEAANLESLVLNDESCRTKKVDSLALPASMLAEQRTTAQKLENLNNIYEEKTLPRHDNSEKTVSGR